MDPQRRHDRPMSSEEGASPGQWLVAILILGLVAAVVLIAVRRVGL